MKHTGSGAETVHELSHRSGFFFYESEELCVDAVIIKSERLISDTDWLPKS